MGIFSTGYEARVAVDPARGVVEGRLRIRVTSDCAVPQSALALEAPEADAYAMRLTAGGGRFTGSASRPNLILEVPLGPGETRTLDFAFQARHAPADLDHMTWLARWHPRVGGRCGVDYRVEATLPPGYRCISSGVADGKNAIATAVRLFGIVAGRSLRVLEGEARGVRLTVGHRPDEEPVARLALVAAAQAVEFYVDLLGVPAFSHVALVTGDRRREGGCPVASGLAALHGLQRPRDERYWRWLVAHEVGHQYFGERLLEADEPGWLWLGLGLYVDLLFMHARGLEPTEHRRILRGWRDAAARGFPTPLSAVPAFDHPDYSRNAIVHGKALAFVMALAETMGEGPFVRVLRRMVDVEAGRPVGRARLQEACGCDALFARWVDLEVDAEGDEAYRAAMSRHLGRL